MAVLLNRKGIGPMKMEYLASGARECPLIRLYQFTPEDFAEFHAVLASLASGRCNSVALHEQSFIEPVDNCHLTLRIGNRDGGIETNRTGGFDCILTQIGWEDELERAVAETPGHHQWLLWDIPTEARLLLSSDGTW